MMFHVTLCLLQTDEWRRFSIDLNTDPEVNEQARLTAPSKPEEPIGPSLGRLWEQTIKYRGTCLESCKVDDDDVESMLFKPSINISNAEKP